jgi:DNA-binding NarL/FixJ family response regulator
VRPVEIAALVKACSGLVLGASHQRDEEVVERVVLRATEALEHQPFFSWQVAKMLLDTYVKQATSAPPNGDLTVRERAVVQLLAEGRNYKSVASSLGLRFKTVETHRSTAMKKVGAKSVVELVRYALRTKMIEP